MRSEHLGFQDFLKMILSVLEKSGIEYMLGGAVAAWAWGEPRSTQDVDLVIHLRMDQIKALSVELEKVEIYVPAETILEDLYENRADLPVNAIHGASGYKAEMFLVRDDDELRKSAFQRRVKVDFGPEVGEVYVHSPEDLILYKMLYYSLGGQTKHVRDIGAILKTMGDRLDLDYIRKWAEKKELSAIWREILFTMDDYR